MKYGRDGKPTHAEGPWKTNHSGEKKFPSSPATKGLSKAVRNLNGSYGTTSIYLIRWAWDSQVRHPASSPAQKQLELGKGSTQQGSALLYQDPLALHQQIYCKHRLVFHIINEKPFHS